MNIPRQLIWCVFLVGFVTDARGQGSGSAFTFQGQLKHEGEPVNDTADFIFSLWDAESGCCQLGVGITSNGVDVIDGLFTQTLDFGVHPYTSDQTLWLQIEVRSPSGSGPFVMLTPRQRLTPAPFRTTVERSMQASRNTSRMMVHSVVKAFS